MAMTKHQKAVQEKLPQTLIYTATNAFEALQGLPKRKFVESIDVAINLGVDPRKSDQAVRGAVILPKGTGRQIRVAVFTGSNNADAALKAGADLVGLDDLAEKVKAGEMDFDVVVASPDAMRVVGQLGQILGPRGLMPNPKDGTVTPDVVTAIKNAKSGQVRYRTDKAGIIHCSIGKISFTTADLKENLEAVLSALKKAKPSTSKGVYIKRVTVSSTMGPGLQVDVSSINI
jgi:large subunit ribosomal protein L1